MMKKLVTVCLIGLSITAQARKQQWISTTADAPWTIEKKMKTDGKTPLEEVKIKINPSERRQQMVGFGGCFNELGWEALKLIPDAEREEIFNKMFSPAEANFSYNRFPIGASDYAAGFYSLNETDGDFNMTNFSIARDKNCLIPYIQKAQRYNPSMTFFASPWCPPSWMKTNNHYASVSSEQYNNLPLPLQSLPGTTGFKMLRGYLEAYALYFSKFLDAYKAEGIEVKDLHVQNEVVAEQIFPSCIWEPQDLSLFIAEYLGPRFEKENRPVNIWFSTLNTGNPEYMRIALQNQKARKYIKGMCFQWDGKRSIGTINKEFPALRLMQTENECGGGENNWDSALHTWELMKIYLNNGAEAYTYWNFVLQNPGVSYWGWTQNSMITIDANTRKVIYNPEFYLMKHLSHFVAPGAYKITATGYEDVLAFQNPDGSCVAVVANRSEQPRNVTMEVDDRKVKATLKANSFNTFCL
ncbi:MAG: glycoside hydrolase family 30 beta sandwich domain-containing protein [Bacteroides sp.]